MADFLKAQRFVLQHEGGYVDDPNDSGGETYRGISRKNFTNWAGWEVVDKHKPLKRGELISSTILDSLVNSFYKLQFWDDMRGDGIDDERVAGYLYDWFVNAGRNAIKEVQRLVGADADGLAGPATVAAINAAGAELIDSLHEARVKYYERIGTGKNERFLKGWLNRAQEAYNLA